jgi:hypothetical protein
MRPVREAALRMVVLLLLVIARRRGRRLLRLAALVQPLKDLRRATERISRGDFDVELDIRARTRSASWRARSSAWWRRSASSAPIRGPFEDPDDDEEPDEGLT